MTQARAPLASDGDHEPSSKLPSLTRENYIRHIVFNRRMYIEPLTSQARCAKANRRFDRACSSSVGLNSLPNGTPTWTSPFIFVKHERRTVKLMRRRVNVLRRKTIPRSRCFLVMVMGLTLRVLGL